MQLVSYSGNVVFTGVTEYAQLASPPALTRPGQAVGLYITIHPDVVEDAAAKFARWFGKRPEVHIVDVGTSDKAGLGFILMEWLECDVDQLFLDVLDDEATIADYTLYGRNLEG
jgi:hypothetical protein